MVLKFYLGGVSFARLESNKTYANNTWFRIQAERDGSEGTNRFRCIEIKQHISWFLALLSIKMIIMLTLMFFRRGVHMYILHEVGIFKFSDLSSIKGPQGWECFNILQAIYEKPTNSVFESPIPISGMSKHNKSLLDCCQLQSKPLIALALTQTTNTWPWPVIVLHRI